VVLGQGKKKKAIPKIKETTKTVLKKKHGLPVILKKKISHYAKKVLKSFGGLKEVPERLFLKKLVKMGTPKLQARQLFIMMDLNFNKKISADEIVDFIADLDREPPKKNAKIVKKAVVKKKEVKGKTAE